MNSQFFTALCFGLRSLPPFSRALPLQPAESCLVYIGTYTGPNSQGIYVCRLDLATGKLQRSRSWRPR